MVESIIFVKTCDEKIEMFWEDGLVAHFFPLRKDFSIESESIPLNCPPSQAKFGTK